MIFCSIYGVNCETIEISCTLYELNARVQWDVGFFIIEQLDSLQVFVLGSKCQDHLFSWSYNQLFLSVYIVILCASKEILSINNKLCK